MTAVSVRRMFGPSEISRNPPARAAESSSSVQPPSGPTASSADAAAFRSGAVFFPSRAERRGGASGRSDRRSCSRAPALGVATRAPRSSNADEGRVEGCNTGGRMRRDCCADSSRIFCQRAARFAAAATSDFSLRAAASGTISATPSSVAFSRLHSKRSNFVMASRRVTCKFGVRAGSRSTSANSTASRPARSMRASQSASPLLNS